MSAIEIIICLLAIIGGILSILAALGLLRLPDVYGRLHAATKSATLGVISLMLAAFLFFLVLEGQFVGKILLTIVFVFLTAPIAGLMMGRSAYRVGVPLSKNSRDDDLAAMYKAEKKRTEQE